MTLEDRFGVKGLFTTRSRRRRRRREKGKKKKKKGKPEREAREAREARLCGKVLKIAGESRTCLWRLGTKKRKLISATWNS